jgi:1-acyl-sn-glycerol-3-phosphate acyltransferase
MFNKIRKFITGTLCFFSYFVVFILSKIFLSIEVYYEDKKFKEVKNPVLIVANHKNIIDPWIIFVSIPFWRYLKILPITAFAKNKFSETKSFFGVMYNLGIIDFVYFIYNVIIVSSGVTFEEKIKPVIDSINEKNTVLMFPEGKITLDTEVGEFKKGAIVVQERTGVPILPCAISHGKRTLFRKKVFVSFGTIVYVPKNLLDKDSDYKKASDYLRKEILRLYINK